ncbi:MAG TPA: helix-turn-helix domain-containing protein [Leptospiraceae bacterium]|nr:helix-turn-helix domain-containing protein [Leptospiraceae bacterium]HMW04041.1 helix-turn-helix domain-containing protein [Leptospiraceae bacterium]HMX30931.1 helix-turn-helix domain-containing protein [Leptospiraceae bacterium]HMY30035.1 helix-turn-helix domain-containing protein [Leptospiraceae bacterium]HMZ62778.1 helix-turn-helix domain-containing protein [Leptospiraceae bacterium]
MKIESIYKHFMVTPVSHLPVVDENSDIIGLISKEKVLMEMSDVSTTNEDYEKIPEQFLDFHITEGVIYYFQNNRTIPVLNLFSQKVDSWEKPRFLAEVSKLNHESPSIKTDSNESASEEMTESKAAIFKFMSNVLASFPDALFATDKEGVTTFYNERFEVDILARSIFRDSISYTEKYFRELNQDLFANYLKSHELDVESRKSTVPVLQAYVKDLSLVIRIITLKNDQNISGFLYHFIDPQNRINRLNEEGYTFPSVEEAFHMNLPLETVIEEVESHYIFQKLKKNDDNISHTANELGIPRSTLQNKMKLLKINEKFGREISTPIPRKRKKVVEKKDDSSRKVLASESKRTTEAKSKKVAKVSSKKPSQTSKKSSQAKLNKNKVKVKTKSKKKK